jgi:ubiquinol-cytochrome c reductase cytochrome c1 subunit
MASPLVARIGRAALVAAALLAAPATALGEAGARHPHAPEGGWSFAGPLGAFDQNQLQRGYRVYREVCASCHSMEHLSFRNLGQPGGPFYNEEHPDPNSNPVVRQIASEYMVNSIDPETGDILQVPARTADTFPSPYANEGAARGANGGALPPDLSVVAMARIGGADYLYSVLVGYAQPPAGLTVPPGLHYNAYFPGDTRPNWAGDPRKAPEGGFIAMSPPLLRDGLVSYDDGTPATIDQMAQDVAAFMAWASEPKQQTRRQLGLAAMGYLLLLAALSYLSYRRIWRNVEH